MGLHLPRQTILQPIGLVTQPNKYGQYPHGAQAVAKNATMRNPGELVQAPDVQGSQSVGSSGQIIHKVIPLDSGHVYTIQETGNVWSIFENANSASFVGSTTGAFSNTGRISWARVAERLIVNGNYGCLVGDYMAPSNSTERALRTAGLPTPIVYLGALEDPANGWLNREQMVAYVACIVRKTSDGYTLRGSPSAPLVYYVSLTDSAPTAPWNPTMYIDWGSSVTSVKVGDIVELYRTDTLPTSSYSADPGTTFKLVAEKTLTSADISATQLAIIDKQPTLPDSFKVPGRELYTNPGQEGSDYANRRPPIAKCMASFKGFAFYGYTKERAEFVFSIPGGWGDGQSAPPLFGVTTGGHKKNGIGSRFGFGTITAGSPTITAVSAADMVGIVVGQRWSSATPLFASTATVTAVGATTITMSANALSSGTEFHINDVLEINGVKYDIGDLRTFALGLDGKFEFTADATLHSAFNTGVEYTIELNDAPFDGDITVRGTNGANYVPPIPEIAQTVKTISPIISKNRIQWSKEQQPEHCPSASEDFVGFGEILSMNAARDALWINCSDGLYRLSGTAGAFGLGAWQVDYVNKTLILAGPQAATEMNEFIYEYANDGMYEIDSAGTAINITDKIIGDLLPGQKYVESRSIVVERNERDGEILLILGDNGSGSSDTVYVFNTKQRGWTTLVGGNANLTKITAMAMQRSPSSGEPRAMFAAAPAGVAPVYAGWNSTSSWLTMEVRYQPIYGDDPLELKRWLWASYLFDAGSSGKTFIPTWNDTQFGGTVTIQALDQGAWARAGCPREVGLSHAISPGFKTLSGSPQSRFQGISIPLKMRTNQDKKR